MKLFLLDTDHFTLYHLGHPQVLKNVASHLSDQLTICVITIEEQLTGWQHALRQAKDNTKRERVYERLALAVEALSGWRVLPLSLTALNRHAGLIRQRLNVGSNDLKIAACALEQSAIVVTRNSRDFRRVAGVVYEDWSA